MIIIKCGRWGGLVRLDFEVGVLVRRTRAGKKREREEGRQEEPRQCLNLQSHGNLLASLPSISLLHRNLLSINKNQSSKAG